MPRCTFAASNPINTTAATNSTTTPMFMMAASQRVPATFSAVHRAIRIEPSSAAFAEGLAVSWKIGEITGSVMFQASATAGNVTMSDAR